MQLKQAKRTKQNLRLALQGDSSTGKTMSALLLAYGITGNWSKIAVIDTENYSASLYSELGPFQTLNIGAPYTVNRYISAIELCEEAGIEVIILDSISPEWVGEGGILDLLVTSTGDYVQKWAAAIPEHHSFWTHILESSCHIICTVRKTSTRLMQEEGYQHYFTTVLNLDYQCEANVIKDRTGIFKDICPVVLNEAIGSQLLTWCEEGEELVPVHLQQQISGCNSLIELSRLLVESNLEDARIVNAFSKRTLELREMEIGKSNNEHLKAV